MKVVGINGFGRIGRSFTRKTIEKGEFDIAIINDISDPKTLSHLLKYDSIHGKFPLSFTLSNNELTFENGKKLIFTQFRNPEEIPWGSYGVDIVLESTGLFLTKEKAGAHIKAGARKVVISAPSPDESIKTIVVGVNDEILTDNDLIVSNASCTTNNVAPMLKILLSILKVEVGYISTIHSYTSDQNLHDAPHKDLRRARAASNSIIPTSTGAANALVKVFPELEGRITGSSVRVPVIDGSMTELTLISDKNITVSEINQAMKIASEGELKGVLGYTSDPIVSVDIIGSSYSCLFDSELTTVINNLVKIVGWYDNEMGYSCRLIDLIKKM